MFGKINMNNHHRIIERFKNLNCKREFRINQTRKLMKHQIQLDKKYKKVKSNAIENSDIQI